METTTLEIYLKGGQVITLKTLEWKVTSTAFSNTLSGFSWKLAENEKMAYIDLEQIAAIVERV